jgi:hypothetical protein
VCSHMAPAFNTRQGSNTVGSPLLVSHSSDTLTPLWPMMLNKNTDFGDDDEKGEFSLGSPRSKLPPTLPSDSISRLPPSAHVATCLPAAA